MRKTTKMWLIIAASLVFAGCIIIGSVMGVLNWDFAKLSLNKYETNKHEVFDNFSAISMNTDTADITFAPSENGSCSVVCYEQEKVTHSVFVKEDTLVIKVVDSRKWYEYIGINFGKPKITVYLPKTDYTGLAIKEDTGDVVMPQGFRFENVDVALSTGDVYFSSSASGLVKIETSTGNIHMEKASAGALDLSASTGEITVSDIACEGDINIQVSTGKTRLTNTVCNNLTADGNTGDIFLEKTIAKGQLRIERSTGDVKFDGCDAAEIAVKTDTGDVSGSLLTDKIFVTKTDTGRVDVPETMTGGKCKIETDTGNIKIKIA